MKKVVLLLSVFFTALGFSQDAPDWPLEWKTKIGLTCYRTNMLMYNGDLLIASNGEKRNSKNDSYDGIYIIDVKTGKIKRQIEGLSLADNDINGLAISNDVLYYGGDMHYIFAVNLKSYKEIWKRNVGSDAESVPAIADLNGDGKDDVIFNIEGEGLQAFNGINGEPLWSNDESTHNGNVSPVAYDLNGDGVKDVICGGNSQFAVNGKDGKTLWKYKKHSGIHGSPLLIVRDSIEIHTVSSYADYDILSKDGVPIAGAGITYGLFASPSPSKDAEYISAASSWHSGGGVYSFKGNLKFWEWEEKNNKLGPGDRIEYHSSKADKVSATAISLDLDGDGKTEFIVADEEGTGYIIHPETQRTDHIAMPSGAEASMFAVEVDGKVKLFYAGLDGLLYCYTLEKAKDIIWGGFRGNNNDGVFVVEE